MNDLSLYNATALAYESMLRSKHSYEWASNDYHEHARKSLYQSDWVRPAAYELSLKQTKWLLANAEFERKKKLFEKLHNIRWEPPVKIPEAA